MLTMIVDSDSHMLLLSCKKTRDYCKLQTKSPKMLWLLESIRKTVGHPLGYKKERTAKRLQRVNQQNFWKTDFWFKYRR